MAVLKAQQNVDGAIKEMNDYLKVYVKLRCTYSVQHRLTLCSTAVVVVEILLGQLAEPSLRSICTSEAGI